MPTITALRVPFRGSRRREIFLDDEKWDDTSIAVIKDLSVAEGDNIQPDALLQRILAAEQGAARDRAYRLLGYREHGTEELRRKLADDGYHTQTIATTTESLVAMGLLDDERFAAVLARTLVLGRGMGRARAMRELLRRGLSEDLVSTALDASCPVEDEYDRAVELARRWHRPGTDARKLAARLMRRGYAPGIAYRASSAVSDETDAAWPDS